MPLTVTWDDSEQSIILVWAHHVWTWEDWHGALDQMIDMVGSTARQVDFIYGSTPGTPMPQIQAMSHYQRALRHMPENAGSHMIVNDKLFARTLMLLFFKSQGDAVRGQFQVVPTLEDARAHIYHYRQQSSAAFLQ